MDDSAMILSQLNAMHKDQKEMREEQIQTKTILEVHCKSFNEFKESMTPVQNDFIERKALKKYKSDKLRSWSWKVGILAGIFTLIGLIINWGA